MNNIFFSSVGIIFRQVVPCKSFFTLEIRLQDIFFLTLPIPLLKSQMVGSSSAVNYLWDQGRLLLSSYSVQNFVFSGLHKRN